MNSRTIRLGTLTALLVLLSFVLGFWDAARIASTEAAGGEDHHAIRRVLLLSIDGMHALDLAHYTKQNPDSTLARLRRMGVTYTNASSSRPSDSFPGLLSIITGGSPLSTGVVYDDSYDRSLSPPDSDCTTVGTRVLFTAAIDIDPNDLDAGGGIDPNKLPRDPRKGCAPVYPHDYLRVNTVFEVIKAEGLRTAWSDKHPAYDIVHGPSGHGVDDLFTPEIAAGGTTGSVKRTEAYDDLKVEAVLNQINGKDHTGKKTVGVPAIFGMNFQAVSVGQKLSGAGYLDGRGTPSPLLLDALRHTDESIGRMVHQLRANGLLPSTLIVVTAKHGQAPMDITKRRLVDEALIPSLVNSVKDGLLAHATQDDIALLWLSDQSRTEDVVEELRTHQDEVGVQEIRSGEAVRLLFRNPLRDVRTPDIIVLPNLGVIYASASSTKIAEHGGFSDQDTNVPLLMANPGLRPRTIRTPVQTSQIAPTILRMLGLNPWALEAVRIEKTRALPGLRLRR